MIPVNINYGNCEDEKNEGRTLKVSEVKNLFVIECTIEPCLLHLLSWHPSLRPYKILFVIGSIYNLLAVVVLSEVFTTLKRYKEISFNFIAPAVLWIQTIIPLGAVAGALLAKCVLSAPGNKMALDSDNESGAS